MVLSILNTTLRSLVVFVLTLIHMDMTLPIGFQRLHNSFKISNIGKHADPVSAHNSFKISNIGKHADPVSAPPKKFLSFYKPRPTAAVLSFARSSYNEPKPKKQIHVIFHSAVGPARSFVSYRNHYSENRNSYSGFDITNSHSPSQQEYLDHLYQQPQERNNRVISLSDYMQPGKQKVYQNGDDHMQIKGTDRHVAKQKLNTSTQQQNVDVLAVPTAQYDRYHSLATNSFPSSSSVQLSDNYGQHQQKQPTETGQNYDFTHQPTEIGQNYDFQHQPTETGQKYDFQHQPTEMGQNYDFQHKPTETRHNYDFQQQPAETGHINNFPQQPTERGNNYDVQQQPAETGHFSQQQSESELLQSQRPNENFQTIVYEPFVNKHSDQIQNVQSAANRHQNTDSHNNGNKEITPTIDNGPVIYSHREALKQFINRNVNDFIKSIRNTTKHDILNKNINTEQNTTSLDRGISNEKLNNGPMEKGFFKGEQNMAVLAHLAKVLSWSPYMSLASVKKDNGYGKPRLDRTLVNHENINNQQKDPGQNQPVVDNHFSQSPVKSISRDSANEHSLSMTIQDYYMKNQNRRTRISSYSSPTHNNYQERRPGMSQYGGPRLPGATVKAVVDPYEVRHVMNTNMQKYRK